MSQTSEVELQRLKCHPTSAHGDLTEPVNDLIKSPVISQREAAAACVCVWIYNVCSGWQHRDAQQSDASVRLRHAAAAVWFNPCKTKSL